MIEHKDSALDAGPLLSIMFINIMENFQFTAFAQEIQFGAGSISNLREAASRYGWDRLLLCTTRSMRANGWITGLEKSLGTCLVAVYDHVLPHVQSGQVEEAVKLAVSSQANAIIGMGGGSAVGLAKAVSHALADWQDLHTASSSPDLARLPVIALPTTYAGSEMTPIFGITHSEETPPRKITVTDPQITPRLVIYDPELTLSLPASLTASSGINALAHCIEALYSVTRNPLSNVAAISAIQKISQSLPQCYRQGRDLEARVQMLLGAHLAGFSLASVKMGLHHGLCHVLGGTYGVPHGIANAIILPYAIRFNKEAAAPQLVLAAGAMGIREEGQPDRVIIQNLVEKVLDLTGSMHLPQRLREAGLKPSDLPHLAELAFQSQTVQNNPRRPQNPEEIERMLEEAW